MLDDEVQILERGGDVIDIGDIERIPVQRDDRWPLVDVDVLDPELLRRLEILVGRLVGELVALRLATPFGGVKLDTLQLVLLGERMKVFDPLVPSRGSKAPFRMKRSGWFFFIAEFRSVVLKPFL